MKIGSTRFLVIAGLIALVICSWYMLIDSTRKENQQCNAYLNAAREAVEDKLYQDALDNYNLTMEFRDSIALREEMAQFYQDHFSASNYEKFCEAIVEDYPYEALGYERLAAYYRDAGSFYICFDVIENAGKRGVESDQLQDIVQELYYAYELRNNSAVMVGAYSAGYCAVQRESGKGGFVNNKGDVAQASQYLDADTFNSAGLAPVQRQDGVYVLVNTAGREKSVAPDGLKIQDCLPLISDKMAVKYDGKYHYCNYRFEELFGAYDYAGAFYCGVAAVQNGGKWAIIDEDGNAVTDFIYEDVELDGKGIAFRGDRALVKHNGKYILIDTEGKQVGSENWEDADAFNADLIAAVKKDGKWGFVNTEGEEVIACQYTGAQSFSNGFAAVKVNGKWGFIDAENHQLVIDAVFDEARDFATKGNVFVRVDAAWYLLRIYRLK